ncbi:hypothetical protein J7643_04200 [bacterium]|nr:hypothetical protein [bacterium]
MNSRQQADHLMRDLYLRRFGDVPYDPALVMEGHRLATAMQALQALGFEEPDLTQALREYMTYWDDATYGGLARYLTAKLAKRKS